MESGTKINKGKTLPWSLIHSYSVCLVSCGLMNDRIGIYRIFSSTEFFNSLCMDDGSLRRETSGCTTNLRRVNKGQAKGVKHDFGRFTFFATRLRTISVWQKVLFFTQKITRLRSKFVETLPSCATQSNFNDYQFYDWLIVRMSS